MSAAFDTSLIQGNILRSYRMGFVRHLLLEVADRRAAKRFLAVSVAGGDAETPAITHDLDWGAVKPDLCFNIGITYEGLKVLGTPAASLATFPTEFIEGMNARALKLGDFGDSSPEKWPAPFDKPKSLHLIASIYAQDEAHVERVQPQVEKSFNLLGVRKGQALGDHKVYFGYRDDISQPRFRGVKDDQTNNADEPVDELGTALLGHPTRLEGLMFRVPSPPELGLYGSFNAFRVLEQDVFTFERYLDKAAKELLGHPKVDVLLPPGTEARIGKNMTRFEALREVVAAQMCGRWRNGAPLATSPDFPRPTPLSRSPISNTTGRRAVPPARISGAPIRAAAGSCSASPITRAASCAAACPTDPRSISRSPTRRSAACSVISSGRASAHSSRRSCATGSISACTIRPSPARTIR